MTKLINCIKKNNIKVIVIVLALVIVISVLFAFIRPTLGNVQSINLTTYPTWVAGSLESACNEIELFLISQKQNTTDRPFKNNPNYTEGSLMALKTAYDNAVVLLSDNSITKTGKDLARIQLIRDVRNLEIAAAFDAEEPIKRLLNNYPDENGEYKVEVLYPFDGWSMPGLEYDIVFALDWSGSMHDGQMAGGKSARTYTEDLIIEMSREIFDSHPYSRISVMGMNSPGSVNLSQNPLLTQIHIETKFAGKVDYEDTIHEVFKNPTAAIMETQDSPAIMFRAASEKLKGINTTAYGKVNNNYTNATLDYVRTSTEAAKNSGRIPVIILISDFQHFTANDTTFLKTQLENFTSYYDDEIVMFVRFNHSDNGPHSSYESTLRGLETVNGNTNYHYEAISSSQTYDQAYKIIKDVIYESTPTHEGPYTLIDPMGDKFFYVEGSFDTSGRTDLVELSETTNKLLKLQGKAMLDRIYKITPDYSKLAGEYPEENLYETNIPGALLGIGDYEGTHLIRSTGAYFLLHDMPKAFLPVTQAAIELYTYEGNAAGAGNIANYGATPKKIISGEDLALFGGSGNYTTDERLTKLAYLGPNSVSFSRSEILEILSSHYSLNNYTINDSFSTSGNLTVVFDVGRNVYKIYASKEYESPALDKTAAWTAGNGKAEITLTLNNLTGIYKETTPDAILSIYDYVDNRYFTVDIEAFEANVGNAYYDSDNCILLPIIETTVDGIPVQKVSFQFTSLDTNQRQDYVTVKIPVKINPEAASFATDKNIPTNYDPIDSEGGAWAVYKDLGENNQEIYHKTPYLETGSVRMHKREQNNINKPIDGAIFELYYANEERFGTATYTTDGEGIILVKNLAPGDYYFKEIYAPQEYYLDNQTNWTFTIVIRPQTGPIEIVVYNQKKNFVLHVRQVVIGTNGKIVIPTIGYMQLENCSISDPSDVSSKMNIATNSGFDNISFSTYNLIIDEHKGIKVIDIIPQYYSYAGHVLTSTEAPHLEADIVSSVPLLDYTNNNEYWLTIYIEPITDIPDLYAWDTAVNKFGIIQRRPV